MAQLTTRERLIVWKAFFTRWAEITCNELDRDIEALDDADEFNRVYLDARWAEATSRLIRVVPKREPWVILDDPACTLEQLDARWALICKHFDDEDSPSSHLPVDVQGRLEQMKRRLAAEYEKKVRHAIDHHVIASPIEQLFLMEWHFQRADERSGVTLHPQQAIKTPDGDFVVDFVVRSTNTDTVRGSVMIELDGHDFHEKTKEQVARDKKRERAIVRESGSPLLRFTGQEVWRDSAACVREVIDYFKPMSTR